MKGRIIMKKLIKTSISFLCAISLVVASSVPVFADSEEDITESALQIIKNQITSDSNMSEEIAYVVANSNNSGDSLYFAKFSTPIGGDVTSFVKNDENKSLDSSNFFYVKFKYCNDDDIKWDNTPSDVNVPTNNTSTPIYSTQPSIPIAITEPVELTPIGDLLGDNETNNKAEELLELINSWNIDPNNPWADTSNSPKLSSAGCSSSYKFIKNGDFTQLSLAYNNTTSFDNAISGKPEDVLEGIFSSDNFVCTVSHTDTEIIITATNSPDAAFARFLYTLIQEYQNLDTTPVTVVQTAGNLNPLKLVGSFCEDIEPTLKPIYTPVSPQPSDDTVPEEDVDTGDDDTAPEEDEGTIPEEDDDIVPEEDEDPAPEDGEDPDPGDDFPNNPNDET